MLRLSQLERPARLTALASLLVLLVSGAAVLATWYAGPVSGSLGQVQSFRWLHWWALVSAVTAVILGASILAATAAWRRWRYRRTVQWAMAALVLPGLLLNVAVAQAGHRIQPFTTMVTTIVFLLALFAVIWVCVGRPADGVHTPLRVGVAMCLPLAAVSIAGALRAPTRGFNTGVGQPFATVVRLLWFLPPVAVVGLLLWLSLDGLTLNRDIALWVMSRLPSTAHLLGGVLVAKVAIDALLTTARIGGDLLSVGGTLRALPSAAVALGLLALGRRLTLNPRSFATAAAVLTVAWTTWLAILFGVFAVVPFLFVARISPQTVPLCLLLGGAAAWCVRSRPERSLRWHACVAAMTATAAASFMLVPAVARGSDSLARQDLIGDPSRTVTLIMAILAGVLPCLLLVLALIRPTLRRPILTVLAALALAALSYRLKPLSFDVAIILIVMGVAAIPATRKAVSMHSLTMIALLTSGVIYANVLALAMPNSLQTLLVPLAFVTPVIAQFTLGANALNQPADGRSARVMVALAVSLLGLGLVLVYELSSGRDEFLNWLADGSAGLVVLPFAIALAASSPSGDNDQRHART